MYSGDSAPPEILALWAQHHPSRGYPPGVVAVPELIDGVAFFPGGCGIEGTEEGRVPRFPVGGIMVLGQDFHTLKGYQEAARRQGEERSPTWSGLRAVLSQELRREAFFTNFFMGLRAEGKATGRFSGAKDRSFVEHCRAFLSTQLRAQRPRVILTLGTEVPYQLGRMVGDLADWGQKRGFAALDWAGPLRKQVQVPGAEDFSVTVAALCHPSHRRLNVGRRRYAGHDGEAAEVQLVNDAVAG